MTDPTTDPEAFVRAFIADYAAWNDYARRTADENQALIEARNTGPMTEAIVAAYRDFLARYGRPGAEPRRMAYGVVSLHHPDHEVIAGVAAERDQVVVRTRYPLDLPSGPVVAEYAYHLVSGDGRWYLEDVYEIFGDQKRARIYGAPEADAESVGAGWDAIESALAFAYPDQEGRHLRTRVRWAEGGPDPLDRISVFRCEEPVPHWHYVGWGLTELYEKESTDPEVSGYGFELTLRLRDDTGDGTPPMWGGLFLQGLARYVFETGRTFAAGDHIMLGPLVPGSALRSGAFVRDPRLPELSTPNGRSAFLQVVGITKDEELAMKQWSADGALALFGEHLPMFVTDPGRRSLLDDPAVRRRLEEGAQREGSSTGELLLDVLEWSETRRLLRTPELRITLTDAWAGEIAAILPYRLPFRRQFWITGPERRVGFFPSDRNAHRVDGASLVLEMRPEAVQEIRAVLQATPGTYRLRSFDGAVFEVTRAAAPG